MSQQINLYNPAFERKRDLLTLPGSAAAWAIALAVAVVAVVAMDVRTGNLEHQLKQTIAEREAAQADMAKLAGQLAARKPDPALATQIQKLEQGVASRKEVMSTLQGGVIGNTQGFSGHLQAFARQSLAGLWLTGLKVAGAGQDVVLEGRATSPDLVPAYLRRLNREEIMQGHVFAELEIRRPDKETDVPPRAMQFIEFRLATSPAPATTANGRER